MYPIVLSVGFRVLPKCEISALLQWPILYCSLAFDALLLLFPVCSFYKKKSSVLYNQLSQQASEILNDLKW